MKLLLLIMFATLLSLTSCDIQKQASKTKTDTDFKETIETTTKRLGDTVTYKNIVHVKDTTIYTVNRQGTTLKTVYDNTGNIASIDCFASAIDEIKKENREFQQSIKDKDKTKTEEFSSTWVLYLIGGVVLMFSVVVFLMYRTINKNSANVAELINAIKNK